MEVRAFRFSLIIIVILVSMALAQRIYAVEAPKEYVSVIIGGEDYAFNIVVYEDGSAVAGFENTEKEGFEKEGFTIDKDKFKALWDEIKLALRTRKHARYTKVQGTKEFLFDAKVEGHNHTFMVTKTKGPHEFPNELQAIITKLSGLIKW